MKRTCAIFSVVLFVALFLAGNAFAIEVFLWQHDNRLAQNDPVLGGARTATDAVALTLDRMQDVNYVRATSLPAIEELNQFDVVMTCLSFYCPG